MTRPDVAWWTDDVRPSADALGRRPFADRVARLIRQLAVHSSSTVLGLVGAWGSGKSTTIEYVLEALDGSGVRVSRCNPWALSGGDAVAADLIASIGAALPDAKGSKAARNS
jgi:predicted KAP-like P-loop ATPase